MAQQSVAPSQPATMVPVSLAEVGRNLPVYLQPEKQEAYRIAIENATFAERDLAIPALMQWLEDDQSKVRALALLTLYLLYIPTEKRPGYEFTSSLPEKYVPAVADHLRDPEPAIRNVALDALLPTAVTGVGLDALIKQVLPMLREPDVVTEYPNPFFVDSDKEMLAGMTPEEQAMYKAHPHKVMKLPAEGAGLLTLLTLSTRQPTPAVDDGIIAFLDREDQTKSTLQDCLHTLTAGAASERVNNEALRRVFEQKAMTIFLLQFVADMRLSRVQLAEEKRRLVELSNDVSAHPALRRSARDVAACWTGKRDGQCKPNSKDLTEQADTQ